MTDQETNMATLKSWNLLRADTCATCQWSQDSIYSSAVECHHEDLISTTNMPVMGFDETCDKWIKEKE